MFSHATSVWSTYQTRVIDKLEEVSHEISQRITGSTESHSSPITGHSVKHCEVCSDLCSHGSCTWYKGPYSTLKRSAKAGCQTCRILNEGYKRFGRSKGRNANSIIAITYDASPSMLRIVLGDREGKVNTDEDAPGILFYTPKGTKSPWNTISEHYEPIVRANPAACAEFLKPVVQQCYSNHAKCRDRFRDQILPGYVPKRLIYIRSIVPHDAPVLYEPRQDPAQPYGPGTPYIALSHCWGKTPLITTTKSNLSAHFRSIPWSSLSKTFQEAIEVSRALGIDYIWIDSLCIIQDLPDDWAHEAGTMAEIYMNAYLTIGASAAESGDEGLYLERTKPHTITAMHEQTPHEVQIRDYPFHELEDMVGASALALRQRSWCLQEELLSVRFVHFTREEMVWACFEGTTCECRHDLRDTFWMRSTILEPSRVGWSELVENFTSRDITYFHDRLPALSGLSKAMGYEGIYLAGLWSQYLPGCLLWRARGYTDDRYNDIEKKSRPPTWSWASLDYSKIDWWIYDYNNDDDRQYWDRQYLDHRGQDHRPEAKIIEAVTFPSSPDPHGLVIGGRMTLYSHLYPLKSRWVRDRTEFSEHSGEADVRIPLLLDHHIGARDHSCLVGLDYQAKLPDKEGKSGKFSFPIYLVVVTSCNSYSEKCKTFFGLLLRDEWGIDEERMAEAWRDMCEGRKRYERIGVGQLVFDYDFQPDDGLLQTVVLV